MYAITYVLLVGPALHRARSARAALEAIATLRSAGARISRIVVTATDEDITETELKQRAESES